MVFTDLSQLSRGDVVLIPFPFTSLAGVKRRPAVLVTDVTKCPSATDGHFVFMTTQQPPAHVPSVPIQDGTPEAVKMGLRFPIQGGKVFIFPLKLATLEVGLVARRIGRTPTSVLQQVMSALCTSIGCSG